MLSAVLAAALILFTDEIAEAVYPGSEEAPSAVGCENPQFIFFSSSECSLFIYEADDAYFFEFSEPAIPPLFSCDATGLSFMSYPSEAPVLIPGRVYAWLLVSCGEEKIYGKPKFFRVESAEASSGSAVLRATDDVIKGYEAYDLLIQSGYLPTGRIFIDGIETDIDMLLRYLSAVKAGKIRIRKAERSRE